MYKYHNVRSDTTAFELKEKALGSMNIKVSTISFALAKVSLRSVKQPVANYQLAFERFCTNGRALKAIGNSFVFYGQSCTLQRDIDLAMRRLL